MKLVIEKPSEPVEDFIMNTNEKVISINELKTLAAQVLNDFEEVTNQKTNALNAEFCLGKFHMIADILDNLSNNNQIYLDDFVELVESTKKKKDRLSEIANGIY